jgi:cell division protein FtsB
MKRRPDPNLTEGMALVCLLVLAAMALFGPSGILAWSENRRLLDQRQQEVKALAAERDELRNRVALLDPRHTDADLAGELLRKDLNVIHPDEMVMLVD